MQSQLKLFARILLFLSVLSRFAGAGTLSFRPALTYSVGTAPNDVAAGDFNGDGKADLAVANFGSATDNGGISILFGNGDGTFQSANNFAAGKKPHALAASDFNRDGKYDLVLIDTSGVGVLLGHGDGTFGNVSYFPTASFPHSLMVSDLDGDNLPDVVVAASSLSVLLGNGDGTFQTHVDYSGSGAGNVVIADMNGDGKMDIINAAGSALAAVLLGNGDGTFQNAIFSRLGFDWGRQVVVADFNRDGKLDIVVSFVNTFNNSSGSLVTLGNGDGTSQLSSTTKLPPFGVMSAADFNGDGKADLVIVSGGVANLFLGNGDGTFQSALSFTVGAGPWSVVSTDLNHDKAPDLMVTNSADNTISILLNTGIDFSISASAVSPGTVTRGQSATSTVTLNLLNAFDNPVALNCSVQPLQSAPACSINPSSVTFDANGNATATLTINTNAAAASLLPASVRQDSRPLQLLWLPVTGLALVGAGFSSRRSTRSRLTGCLLGGILLAGLSFQAACGGGSGDPGSTTYAITVTGTSGSTQHSTTAMLKVR